MSVETTDDDILVLCTSDKKKRRLHTLLRNRPEDINRVGIVKSKWDTLDLYTPLEYAVQQKQLFVIEMLLNVGADIDLEHASRLEDQQSPFSIAVQWCRPSSACLLIAYGVVVTQEALDASHDGIDFTLEYFAPLLAAEEIDFKFEGEDFSDCNCHTDPLRNLFCRLIEPFAKEDAMPDDIEYRIERKMSKYREWKDRILWWRLRSMRRGGFEACVGLAALNLPAFVMLLIIEQLNYAILALPMHYKWDMVCKIKHARPVEDAEKLAANPHKKVMRWMKELDIYDC